MKRFAIQGTLLLAVLACSGCRWIKTDPSLDGYELTVPENIPERCAVEDKWGKSRPTEGRKHYAAHHRMGWLECFRKWEAHDHQIPEEVPVSDAPITSSGFLLAERARRDGFAACQKYLREREQVEIASKPAAEPAIDDKATIVR